MPTFLTTGMYTAPLLFQGKDQVKFSKNVCLVLEFRLKCSIFEKNQRKQTETHLPNSFKTFVVNIGEDVCLWIVQDLKGTGAVMIFQRRDVIVANRQLSSGVYLISMKKNAEANSNKYSS